MVCFLPFHMYATIIKLLFFYIKNLWEPHPKINNFSIQQLHPYMQFFLCATVISLIEWFIIIHKDGYEKSIFKKIARLKLKYLVTAAATRS